MISKKVFYYRIYCNTESNYVYTWKETTPTACPNNNGHSINTETISILETVKNSGEFDTEGKMLVKSGTLTQFGEQRVSIYDPIFQNYALYNIINDQIYTIFSANGGTVTGNSNGTEIDLNITSTIGSYAVIRSTKVCKYRPGYNIVVRWNTIFDNPVANLLQFGGLGNIGSDIYFCYNGLNFGVRYSTGGYSEVRQLLITSAETTATTASIVLNGVTFIVNLTNANGNINFTVSELANATYNGWLVNAIENTLMFTSTSVGDRPGTFSYTSSGTSSGVFSRIKQGSALSTTFIHRNDWNGYSRMVQDFDPLMRNMFSIEYAWYGSGNMVFKIYDPESSTYETIHTISFANTTTEPSLSQPNMYLQQGIASLGSTTAKKIRVAGGFAAVEGTVRINLPIYSVNNDVSIPSGIETVLIGLRNRDSICGFTNNSETLIRKISINVDGTKGVCLKIIKNPTALSSFSKNDYLNWQYIHETQSIGLVTKTARSFTGGNTVATYYMPKSSQDTIDLTDKEIQLYKGETIIFTVISSSISEINIAIQLVEDY